MIGRFISPDSFVQDMANPQTLNRYSYCLNNPLKYVDPSGHNAFTDWWTKSLPSWMNDQFGPKALADYYCGMWQSFKDTWHAITNPGETFNNLDKFLAMPDHEAVKAIKDDFVGKIETPYGRGQIGGDILQMVLLGKVKVPKSLKPVEGIGLIAKELPLAERINAFLISAKAEQGYWGVAEVSGKSMEDAQKLFAEWGAEGTLRTTGSYNGIGVNLPNREFIGLRTEMSKLSPNTIVTMDLKVDGVKLLVDGVEMPVAKIKFNP